MIFDIFALSCFALGQTVLSFCFGVLTTRLLEPQIYGLVAQTVFLFSLFGALTDFGLENAFLASSHDRGRVFWTHFFVRLVFAFGALPIALWALGFRLMIFLLWVDFFIQKLSFTPKLESERCGITTRLGSLEFIATVGGCTTTFCLAFGNFGEPALIIGQLVRNTTQFCFYFWACPVPKIVIPSLSVAKSFFLTFGIHGTLSSCIGALVYDFMPFFVGKCSGAVQAGLYARSFSLAIFPLSISGVFSRLSVSAYSSKSRTRASLAQHLAILQLFKVFVVVPGILFLIAFAPMIFKTLFGARWTGAVGVYRMLSLYTLARLFYDDVTNVLSVGLGKPQYLTLCQTLQASIILFSSGVFCFWPKHSSALTGACVAAFAMVCATTMFWIAIERELVFFSLENIQFYKSFVAKLVSHFKKKTIELVFMSKQEYTNKKILFVSQFSQSSTGYCYAEFFVKLANSAGLTVDRLDCKYNYFQIGPKSSDFLFWPLRSICNVISNLQLIFKCIWLKPEVVFLIKGENIWHKTLKLIKLLCKPKLVNFYPDSPFSFHNGNSNSNVLLSLPLYDRFAIWSKPLAEILIASGCKEVFYWPFLCDKNIFKPLGNDSQSDLEKKYYHSDVCFVGTWDKKREEFLVHLIRSVKNLNLKIWGEFWSEKTPLSSPLYQYIKGPSLQPLQMSKAFCGAKIVLNFLKDQNLASHNMRTFEVVSTNAFLLTERSEAHSNEIFTEDESVACFATCQELVSKVNRYLNETDARFKIAKAGRERIEKMADSTTLFKNLIMF